MDKLINVKEPDETSILYTLMFENAKGELYSSHLSPEEYAIMVLKRKLVLEFSVPETLVEDFEDAIKATADENDAFGV